MLKLIDIKKDYVTGDTVVSALRGVDLEFRKSEFVAILGHSGCGKTTLLNIIGGLDKYTSGDLIINGISTKFFTDSDWDTYRNHSIGFVFQSYNLIPHQTVLSNVELALTLSGVSKEERRKKATEALQKVGLGDQLHKRPNQMSGGQMQRVAIARALVNDPDILMADEPTGALDSETSVQIMEILKEISKDKLIIMVTHNPELADEYANRIIRLKDGLVEGDTNPYISANESAEATATDDDAMAVSAEECAQNSSKRKSRRERKNQLGKKKSMSFFTALLLSLNNLLTKKGRTFLTAFAGSIGIIGIALILSVSTGVNRYIDSVEESTMSSYPIEINDSSIDTMSLLQTLIEPPKIENKQENTIYSNDVMINVMNAMSKGITANNLTAFKAHISSNTNITNNATDIKYRYTAGLNTYTVINKIDQQTGTTITTYRPNLSGISDLMGKIMPGATASSSVSTINSSAWSEFVGDIDYIKTQYKLVDDGGRFPQNENEVVLVVGKDLVISDFILYIIGIRDYSELTNYLISIYDDVEGNELTISPTKYTFDDILNYEFKVIPDSEKYKVVDGRIIERDIHEIDFANAETLKIVGIVTPADESASANAIGSIGYMPGLMDKMIDKSNDSEVVKLQKENTTTNLFDGIPFAGFNPDLTAVKQLITLYAPDIAAYVKTDAQLISSLKTMLTSSKSFSNLLITAPWGGFTMADIVRVTEVLTNIEGEDAKLAAQLVLYAGTDNPQNILNIVNSMISTLDYDGALAKTGYVNKDKPSKILIYPKDFESKDIINDEIKAYNASVIKEDQITYTDTVGLLMSSVTTIVNAITYVLIAFVAISLVVSSIMIGIITYISVLERTKEIGILRSIGASKKDISRVFNAETLIVGFTAGVIGILVSLFFIVIINIILHALTGLQTLSAVLPVGGAITLIIISMVLTLIAGLVPSRIAAKKDPVIALRTE